MIRAFSFDPADGSSKGQARVGLLHLLRQGAGARAGADLQPSEDEGDHRG